MGDVEAYGLLISVAFISATLVPLGSEVLVVFLIEQQRSALFVMLVATFANTLGSYLNYWLGRKLLAYRDRRWFYFTQSQITRATTQFRRYGTWSLLLAWLPIVGDALTLAAGMARVKLSVFVLFVGLGKFGRYWVVVHSVSSVL